LVQQPAFDKLKPEELAALLEVVVDANDEYNFSWLTKLSPYAELKHDNERSAFKQLDAATVASLLMLAVNVAGRGQIKRLAILRDLWECHAAQQLREDLTHDACFLFACC
jgi:hypothetical protein